MIRAASVDVAINLAQFSQQLYHSGIDHRIVEESGKQTIWVNDDRDAYTVQQRLDEWFRSAVGQTAAHTSGQKAGAKTGAIQYGVLRWLVMAWFGFRRCPITWVLIIACTLVAMVSRLGMDTYSVRALFYPLLPEDNFLLLLGVSTLSQKPWVRSLPCCSILESSILSLICSGSGILAGSWKACCRGGCTSA